MAVCHLRYNRSCHVRIAVEEWGPWIRLDVSNATNNLQISGPMRYLIDSLSTSLNITYSIRQSHDRTFGALNEDGNWTGVIGMIQREESDIAVGPMSRTLQRMQSVGFSDVVAMEDFGLLLWRPEKSTEAQYSYFFVLSTTVWILLGLSLGLISLVETIHICALTNRSVGAALEAYTNELWKYFSIQFRQSINLLKMDSRFLLACWFLSATVMTSTFGGNLVSLLLKAKEEHSIEKLTDLVKFPKVGLVVSKGSSYREWLRGHPDYRVRQLYRAMIKKNNSFVPLSEFNESPLMERVAKRTAVVFSDRFTLAYMLSERWRQEDRCIFNTKPQAGTPRPLAMAWNPNLPRLLKNDINHVLHRIWSNGVIKRMFMQPFHKASSCSQPTVKGEGTPLNLGEFKGVFHSWGVGVVLSIVGFASECLIWKVKSIVDEKRKAFESAKCNWPTTMLSRMSNKLNSFRRATVEPGTLT